MSFAPFPNNPGMVFYGPPYAQAARVDRAPRLDVRKFFGAVRRNFRNGSAGFANLANSFATDGNGNLIAGVAGVTGQGDITLPAIVGGATPFAFCARVYIDATDAVNSAFVWLTDSADTNYGVVFSCGGGSLTFNAGGIGASFFLANPPTGFYDLFVVSDGAQVTIGYAPITLAPIGSLQAGAAVVQALNAKSGAFNQLRFDGVNPIWANINIIRLQSNSTKHKIAGTWCNCTSVTAPEATTFGVRAHIPVLTPTDYDELVRLPAGYDGKSPIDLVVSDHANASDKLAPARSTDPDSGLLHTKFLDTGYALAYCRGDTVSFVSAGASPWGGQAGLATRKAFIDYLLATFPQLRNIYWLGHSMGCLDGLNFHATYPGILRALIGVSGVCNLSYAYNTEGFSGPINTGYGTASLPPIEDRDPCLRPDVYADLPLLLFHGTADVTIHKANHPDVLAPLVIAAGGNATNIAIAGGGHLDGAMLNGVDAQFSAITAFLTANQ